MLLFFFITEYKISNKYIPSFGRTTFYLKKFREYIMLRTSITQKQYEVSRRNGLTSTLSLEHTRLEPSSIIKTMIKIIKIKSIETMDAETRVQFSMIADAIIRMVEDIRE
ncbi:Uncharacterised protein [uncultured archaeon]|nr:Uncharacterised protein [uncultured archaeon]